MSVLRKRLAYASLAAVVALMSGCGGSGDSIPVQAIGTTILYTSDAHYGLKRAVVTDSVFGKISSAQQVNGAMVGVMNTLATQAWPSDGGITSGRPNVDIVDFVVETGDAVNRSEKNVYPYSIQHALIFIAINDDSMFHKLPF